MRYRLLVARSRGPVRLRRRPTAPPSKNEVIAHTLATTVQLVARATERRAPVRIGGPARRRSGAGDGRRPRVRHHRASCPGAGGRATARGPFPGRTAAGRGGLAGERPRSRPRAARHVRPRRPRAARLRQEAFLGDEVWVVAFPWGRRRTVVKGVVSQIAAPDGGDRGRGADRRADPADRRLDQLRHERRRRVRCGHGRSARHRSRLSHRATVGAGIRRPAAPGAACRRDHGGLRGARSPAFWRRAALPIWSRGSPEHAAMSSAVTMARLEDDHVRHADGRDHFCASMPHPGERSRRSRRRRSLRRLRAHQSARRSPGSRPTQLSAPAST